MCDVLLDFSVRLNDVLRDKGIPYTERNSYLVDLMGLHPKTIHNWLTGISCPSLDASENLAKCLNTTHLYLMTGVVGDKGYFTDVLDRLVDFLRESGVSDSELSVSLSRIACVTHNSAISWLEGKTHPTFNKLETISVNLKIKSYWLLTGCNTSNVSEKSRNLLSTEIAKYNELAKIRINEFTRVRKKERKAEMAKLLDTGFSARLNAVMDYYGYPLKKRAFFLADISKAPKVTAELWLSGQESPLLCDAKFVANYFKVPTDWLYLGEGSFSVDWLPAVTATMGNEESSAIKFANRLNQALDDAEYPKGKERFYRVQALTKVSSFKAVQGWCLGDSVPRPEIVSMLALALNVKLDWLCLGVKIPEDYLYLDVGSPVKNTLSEENFKDFVGSLSEARDMGFLSDLCLKDLQAVLNKHLTV